MDKGVALNRVLRGKGTVTFAMISERMTLSNNSFGFQTSGSMKVPEGMYVTKNRPQKTRSLFYPPCLTETGSVKLVNRPHKIFSIFSVVTIGLLGPRSIGRELMTV